MNQLIDYVKTYDALDPSICSDLIEIFEQNNPLTNPFYRQSNKTWNEDYRNFLEADITHIPEFKNFITPIYNVAQSVYQQYKQEVGTFFPSTVGFENLRLKRYDANDYDQFGWHSDVGDHASARRFLVMFFYLNDVESGGETQFEFSHDYDKSSHFTIKPKCGRIVVFPPMWMYPHRGCKPISGPKYILSTYAHYQ
jgi:prolyl 4-hydroxylase